MDHIKKILEQKANSLSAKQSDIDYQSVKLAIYDITKELEFSIRIQGKKLQLIAPNSMIATELYHKKAAILTKLKSKSFDISQVVIKTSLE